MRSKPVHVLNPAATNRSLCSKAFVGHAKFGSASEATCRLCRRSAGNSDIVAIVPREKVEALRKKLYAWEAPFPDDWSPLARRTAAAGIANQMAKAARELLDALK